LVEPALGRISRESEGSVLRAQVMELLVYMARHRGRVISLEDLLDDLWAGKVVASGTVYNCVGELRHALSDGNDQPAYIETIPKKGYRLLAPVTGLDDGSGIDRGKRNPKLILASAVTVALVTAIVLWPSIRNSIEHSSAEIDPASIAVLPFVDMSPDGDQEYFGDGIAEELRNKLTRLEGLRVAGRTSSFSYKESDDDLQTIGEALRVDSILEGSIRKDGDIVRITAQLINAVDGYYIWTDTYNRELSDIFAIQEEIAMSVAGALGVRLGVGGVNAFKGAGTQNVEAYEAFLKASQLSDFTQFANKIRLLERAKELDPNYAAAWAQLGLITAATMWITLPDDAPAIIARAYLLVRRAVELDPASAEAQHLLATILYARWDWIGAENAYAKALSLHTDRPSVSQRANMLMRAGRSAMARRLYDMAESLEPLGGRPAELRFYVSLAQLRFTEAKEFAAWRREPSRTEYVLEIALNEDDPEGIKTAIRALPKTNISTGALYVPVLSAFDTPEMVLSTLRTIYADEGTQWPSKLHDIALLAAYFGDPEFALRVKAQEVRKTPVRQGALWYPVMSEVRRLPEFKELVTEINLIEYWGVYGWADTCRPLGEDDFSCI
jgi:TolB-like protein/DNA-binding winged helix-turn-helix (wHTH) protein